MELTGANATMPALAESTYSHTHTLHSALVSLEALGVGAHRLVLRRVGRDARPAGTIVAQSPAPGSPLTGSTLIRLDIAGLGFTHALPVGMWDSGGEAAAGTREILEPFDDPLEKLKHWFHEGAPLFRLSPQDPAACARWLGLFGIHAEDWPPALWYRLASLVAGLAQLAGSPEGCVLLPGVLLDLPVKGMRLLPSVAELPPDALSALGSRSSRLGVDLVMGDTAEDLAVLELEIGPVPLGVYQRFAETAAGARLLNQVLALVIPMSTRAEIRWLVEDASRPPRLGVADENCRLGINTHMGAGLGSLALPAVP